MEPLSPNRQAWNRFQQNRPALLSALFLLVVAALVSLGPLVSPFKPDAITDAQFQAPSLHHWFGTDLHGRDLLARILYGTRLSLLVGAVGAGVSLVIGVLWGATAGYLGGRWDGAMMRFVDVLYSMPSIVFVILLMTTMEDRFKSWLAKAFSIEAGATVRLIFLFAGLGAVSWLTMARIVRGQVLSLRTRPFVEASRALGASHARVLWRHILPNTTGIVIVYLALTVPAVILYESFLSYLGLGIQPPQASLGSLLAEGAAQINPIRSYWWIIICPAATLALTLLAANFFAAGLRDALDPRAN